jgi:hypothetical protein
VCYCMSALGLAACGSGACEEDECEGAGKGGEEQSRGRCQTIESGGRGLESTCMVPCPPLVMQQRSVIRYRVVMRCAGTSRMSRVAHGCFVNGRSTGDWF